VEVSKKNKARLGVWPVWGLSSFPGATARLALWRKHGPATRENLVVEVFGFSVSGVVSRILELLQQEFSLFHIINFKISIKRFWLQGQAIR
jgi:hypothetical protein